jgi:4-amino-4-deoxychorismate lyase
MPAAGLSVITAQQYIARQPLLAGHKHLNRLEQVFLRQEVADHQADEAIVCDTAGYVVEGVSTNVFGVKQGALFTPKLNQAGVKGVMRQAILAYADQIHLPVEEDHYTAEYFAAADELFFCNSVMGILPVHQWHQKKWVTGTVTQKLLDFWQSLLREQ